MRRLGMAAVVCLLGLVCVWGCGSQSEPNGGPAPVLVATDDDQQTGEVAARSALSVWLQYSLPKPGGGILTAGQEATDWLKINPIPDVSWAPEVSVLVQNNSSESVEGIRVRVDIDPKADWWWGFETKRDTGKTLCCRRGYFSLAPSQLSDFERITSAEGLPVDVIVPGETVRACKVVLVPDPGKTPERCTLKIRAEVLNGDMRLVTGTRTVEVVNTTR